MIYIENSVLWRILNYCKTKKKEKHLEKLLQAC